VRAAAAAALAKAVVEKHILAGVPAVSALHMPCSSSELLVMLTYMPYYLLGF
jgi:hypothetical protein